MSVLCKRRLVLHFFSPRLKAMAERVDFLFLTISTSLRGVGYYIRRRDWQNYYNNIIRSRVYRPRRPVGLDWIASVVNHRVFTGVNILSYIHVYLRAQLIITYNRAGYVRVVGLLHVSRLTVLLYATCVPRVYPFSIFFLCQTFGRRLRPS